MTLAHQILEGYLRLWWKKNLLLAFLFWDIMHSAVAVPWTQHCCAWQQSEGLCEQAVLWDFTDIDWRNKNTTAELRELRFHPASSGSYRSCSSCAPNDLYKLGGCVEHHLVIVNRLVFMKTLAQDTRRSVRLCCKILNAQNLIEVLKLDNVL